LGIIGALAYFSPFRGYLGPTLLSLVAASLITAGCYIFTDLTSTTSVKTARNTCIKATNSSRRTHRSRSTSLHGHSIDLHANLVDYSELEIAKAFAHHSVETGLPKHYAPNHVVPEGKMRVVGIQAKKISSTKAVLIVKFRVISPPSLKNVHIQLFCTSLEPLTKQGQGADLSIITPLKITNTGAKSLFDLGFSCKPRSDTTRGMIADLDSILDGTIFDASQASSDDFETSEQNPFGDECHLRSSRDPVGYSKGAPDPKHHGRDMRSAMTRKAEWIKSQSSEMDGLWRCGVFQVQKVLLSSLTPQDRVFTSRSITR